VENTGKAAVAEFIATFALVFVGAGSVIQYANGKLDLTGVALAHGLVLAIMVSLTMHTSGGLVNPAVAIALWVTGKLDTIRTGVYIVAEVLGAVAGGFLLKALVPGTAFRAAQGGTPTVLLGIAPGKAVLFEAVASFFLIFAVFATAVDSRGPAARAAGFTIGLTIAFDILAFGPYTGAAMNPARWFGSALAAGVWTDWWVWIVGPVAGGIIAAVGYWAVFLRDSEPATP
jgi:MIP family channel proteins